MTEKRFRLGYVCGDFGLIDNDKWIDLHSMSENSEKNVQICINKMNDLAEENEQLKSEKKDMQFLINTISDQRNEFHRGARENANRVGKLKKENEQLKKEIKAKDKIIELYYEMVKL